MIKLNNKTKGRMRTENELITEYNKLREDNKDKNPLAALKSFSLNDWLIFIAVKTYRYGRSFEASMENAECLLKKFPENREKLVKQWGAR